MHSPPPPKRWPERRRMMRSLIDDRSPSQDSLQPSRTGLGLEDGLQRRGDAPGQVTVLVRPSARPTRIELAGAENQPSQFLKAESLKLTFEGFDRVLALPLTDRPLTDRRDTGGAYVRGVLGVSAQERPATTHDRLSICSIT